MLLGLLSCLDLTQVMQTMGFYLFSIIWLLEMYSLCYHSLAQVCLAVCNTLSLQASEYSHLHTMLMSSLNEANTKPHTHLHQSWMAFEHDALHKTHMVVVMYIICHPLSIVEWIVFSQIVQVEPSLWLTVDGCF